MPGNDGRGYVVRRILRRALRFGRTLGLNEPFLNNLVDGLSAQMKDTFPEINDQIKHVKKVILAEEKSFNKTLGKGLVIFERICKNVKKEYFIRKNCVKFQSRFGSNY